MSLEMILGSAALDYFILGLIFVLAGLLGLWFDNLMLAYFLIGLLSVLFLIGGRPFLQKKLNSKGPLSNADALIGQTGYVKKWNEKEGSGQIEVGNELWLAKGQQNFLVGDKVTVQKIIGNTLSIKK